MKPRTQKLNQVILSCSLLLALNGPAIAWETVVPPQCPAMKDNAKQEASGSSGWDAFKANQLRLAMAKAVEECKKNLAKAKEAQKLEREENVKTCMAEKDCGAFDKVADPPGEECKITSWETDLADGRGNVMICQGGDDSGRGICIFTGAGNNPNIDMATATAKGRAHLAEDCRGSTDTQTTPAGTNRE